MKNRSLRKAVPGAPYPYEVGDKVAVIGGLHVRDRTTSRIDGIVSESPDVDLHELAELVLVQIDGAVKLCFAKNVLFRSSLEH